MKPHAAPKRPQDLQKSAEQQDPACNPEAKQLKMRPNPGNLGEQKVPLLVAKEKRCVCWNATALSAVGRQSHRQAKVQDASTARLYSLGEFNSSADKTCTCCSHAHLCGMLDHSVVSHHTDCNTPKPAHTTCTQHMH